MDDCLKRLERRFLNMYPLKLLSPDVDAIIEKANEMGSDWQKDIINSTVKHPLNMKHEIDPKYEHAFLKLVISRLESEGIEVCDELYENLCNLLSYQKEQDTVFKHYILDDTSSTCISLKESRNIISQGTTGLHSWQAAQALADWCVSHSEELRDKEVLELGSGVGLTGITTVLCCELRSYSFSDCHAAVLSTLCENVLLNLSTPNEKDCHRFVGNVTKTTDNTLLRIKHKNTDVAVMNLPWADVTKNTVPEVDFVLAADVVYDTSTFTELCQALKNLLHYQKTVAIIACTVRDQNTLQQFLHTLAQYEIKIVQIDVPSSRPTHFLLPQDVLVNIYRLQSSGQ
ncbi:protein-lysine N-methyltransferase EEF2KMT isoform X1 [Schistocerca serialis cubense]|uniref:protein-lysine N-methyltransferase EEF2KMT isoform X1 n=1 Tax=Schistocerca serialis cubense TaxID=2023355 RepID=UPI00214E4EF7|nr:protein-lysine N-methyltransferase EEF2KMT isoform X1 [Schistocerca serialis cubense]